MSAADSIRHHEGYSETPYRCTADKWTIGDGINIDSMPMPSYFPTIGAFLDWLCRADTHQKWFEKRLAEAERGAKIFAGEAWEGLSEARQAVLIELNYWIGYTRLSGFKRFRAAVQAHQWVKAEAELLDSKLHQQVPGRTETLASRFLEG